MLKFVERRYINTVSEFKFYTKNRCFTTNIQDLEKYDFNYIQMKTFIARTNLIKRSLTKYGFLDCCEIKVAKYKGEYYIIDGQGRAKCLEEINAKNKENGLPLIEIPCLIYKASAERDLFNAIRAMNEYQLNWTKEDKYRSEKLHNLQYKKNVKVYEETDYILNKGITLCNANIIIFGQNANKIRFERTEDKIWNKSREFTDYILDLQQSCKKDGWDIVDYSKIITQRFLEVARDTFYKRIEDTYPKLAPEAHMLFKRAILNLSEEQRTCISTDRERIRNILKAKLLSRAFKKSKELNKAYKEIFAK